MDQLSNEIVEFGNTHSLPVVALNDVYFLTNEDGWMQDMLHCIQTGREIDIDDQNNSKLSQHYLKSDEMIELFKDVPMPLVIPLKLPMNVIWN